MHAFIRHLTRRKVVDFGHSELRRVLGVLDLTMLGVGSTIGVGIYVLAGQVSRETSGPAVTISFLIAAVASMFAGLCYAEFGARVPKAGSAYIYTYVCIGEFVAFIIGWNLILEYVIGTASVARGFSQYVDALANNSIEEAFYDAMPLVPKDQYTSSFLSPYPDFLSFGLSVVLSVALALGVKESSRMNNIFTGINILVITFVIIAAGYNADPHNWNIPEDEIDATCNSTGTSESYGTGGFAPFGFEGIMKGAATCFFGFVGFDIIATTGEEALNPSRTIPLSIGISLSIIFLSYFGVSAVITLALPYCLQDKDAPLVVLFDQDHIGWEAAKWFISIGALFGFSASLFGAMFPLPRVIYAMASDGLLFRTLSQISKKFQTPTFATALSGIFAGGMAMLFNLDALVKMMSIGTLMAYTIVALCVLLLRYTVNEEDGDEEEGQAGVPSPVPSSFRTADYLKQLFNSEGLTSPTELTASLVTGAVLCFCVLVLVLDVLLVALSKELSQGHAGAIAGVVVMVLLNILNLIVIARQPVSKKKLSFKVPLVPWLPALSTFINLYLMCNLELDTWFRFIIWMAIGFLDYFAYGLWHSSLRKGTTTKHGLDNLGYSDDNIKNHQLVIPKIEIQPATPLSSEPNTPATKPKGQAAARPPSPLAGDETAERHTTLDETKRETIKKDDVVPLDAAAVVASLMLTGKAVKEAKGEENKEGSDKEVQGNGVVLKDGTRGSEGSTDGDEMKDRSKDKEGQDAKRKMEDVGKDEEVDGMVKESKGDGDDDGKVKQLDVVDGILLSKASASLSSESPNDTTERAEDDGEAEKEKKTQEEENVEEKKSRLSKPPPLILPSANSEEEKDPSSGIPRAYYSSPELSPPPSPPPSSPASPLPPPLPSSAPPTRPVPVLVRSQSEANLIRSVPTTPAGRRHPVKVLRRMSSFDDIPPSSPDSPFAKRIDKFIVIQVQEPGMESEESSVPPSPSAKPDPRNGTLFQAVDMLNKYKKDEDKKLFTLGSTDSLDKFSGDEGNELLNPRRMLGREPDILDPIRERGESKLYVNGEEKTDTHTPQEDATRGNVLDGNSVGSEVKK